MTSTKRVKIIAVGIGKYQHLQKLPGPIKDIEMIETLLCKNHSTALYTEESDFKKYVDVTSSELRNVLTEYVLGRSAPNDILVFYFSGHGIPLGDSDLGFCTTETKPFENGAKAPLPLNLVRFSDIIESLAAARVDPIFIIDACYSGQAGEAINRIYTNLESKTKQAMGSAYAMLCACTKYEETSDGLTGGVFSSLLTRVAHAGVGGEKHRNSATLSLQDIYAQLKKEAESSCDTTPRFFCGNIPIELALVKNTKFNPRTENLRSHYRTLLSFWHKGKPRMLNTDQLRKIGSTEHTTYSKLSYGPAWALINKHKRGKGGELSERGIDFLKNTLRVPEVIQKNPTTGEWTRAEGAPLTLFRDMSRK